MTREEVLEVLETEFPEILWTVLALPYYDDGMEIIGCGPGAKNYRAEIKQCKYLDKETVKYHYGQKAREYVA